MYEVIYVLLCSGYFIWKGIALIVGSCFYVRGFPVLTYGACMLIFGCWLAYKAGELPFKFV